MKKILVSKFFKCSRLVFTLAGIFVLLLLGTEPLETASEPVSTITFLKPSITAAQQNECLDSGRARTSNHAQTGRLRFIGTEAGRPIARRTAPGALGEAVARDYLSRCGSLFGLVDQSSELVAERTESLEHGRSMVRFQQLYRGLPVFGGELIVNLDEAKNITSLSGEILPGLSLASVPKISAASAEQVALESAAKKHGVKKENLTAERLELWIYNPILIQPGGGFTSLVWRTEVRPKGLAPIRELVLVDAQRGGVALSFNQVDTAKSRETYTAGNTTTLPGTLICNEANPACSGGDSHAIGAHQHAGETYDFYWNYFGRDSINNAGMTMVSSVHYWSNYCNAYWDRLQMVYGDGCGMPLADDVVAHELTHAVTQYSSNLFYYYQSGAINESFSDVFGEFVDLTNGTGNDSAGVRWLMGEDITGLGAIRSMSDPPAFSNPDKMTSPYYYVDENDSGGVHTNSGINNKAAYLMTDGGSFNGYTISGLGLTKVAKIYYEANTNLLTSGADYSDLYDALNQACNNLINSGVVTFGECQQVRNATLAVEMNQQPKPGFNPDAPLCGPGQTPIDLSYDSFDDGLANWTTGQFVGMTRWGSGLQYSGYAHSGLESLYGNDYPAAATDTFAAMSWSVALPTNAKLHFSHAFGFENSGYDGGVLEYSTNGGGSWNDAGSLMEVNGYRGTLKSTSGNPLGGRSAFVGQSHGYISTRLNLGSLAGQGVRFRFRMGLDSTIYDWGWWVDDVRIYTCNTNPATQFLYLPFVLKSGGAQPSSNWINILTEDFEGTFPGPWTLSETNGYTFGKRDCRVYDGSYGAWAVGGGANGSALACKSNYPNNVVTRLTFGPFSLAGATAAELRYKLYLYTWGWDYFAHFASVDGTNFYGWDAGSGWISTWDDRVFDLSNVPTLGNLLGQPSVWIRLRFVSDGSMNYPDGAAVDNVVLRKCTSSCTTFATSARQSDASPSFDALTTPQIPFH
jgi:bacillolysin